MWTLIRGIARKMQNTENDTSQLRLAIAFIAGMILAAILAQTPLTAGIFPPKLSHESTVPTLPARPDSAKPGSPDTTNPVKPRFSELVYTSDKGMVSPC
jgi:hypothetical protein